MTFCWSAIVNLLPFLSYLTSNDVMSLKYGLEVSQGHSKSHCWVPISVSLKLSVSVFRTVYDIFSMPEWRYLESRGGGRSRSLKWRLLIDHIRLFGPKSWFFHAPWIWRPVGGVASEYCHSVWSGWATWWWINFEHMYKRLDTLAACDGWTDRRAYCDGTVRTMLTRRVVTINARSLTVLNLAVGWAVCGWPQPGCESIMPLLSFLCFSVNCLIHWNSFLCRETS